MEDGEDSYKVAEPGKAGGTDSEETSVRVSDTVKIGGAAYKVTSVAKGAFEGNRGLKKVTIGKNVTK